MSATVKAKKVRIAEELATIYKHHGQLNPEVVVTWASKHPASATHARFTWDNTVAGHQYRLWQARELITEVEVTYPDGKTRQVYVSPIQERGPYGGYAALVEVLSDSARRAQFLMQALAEYERVGAKYSDLRELASIRTAVARARKKTTKPKKPKT